MLGLTLALAACAPQPAPTPPPPASTETKYQGLQALKPGVEQDITATLKVNVVMVGYHPTSAGQVAGPRDVNVSDFTGILPETSRSIARIPSAYGKDEYTGNSFKYQYNYVYASKAFEDEFFGHLNSIKQTTYVDADGETRNIAPTVYQQAYNCQDANADCDAPAGNITLPVTSNVWIDGPSTEKWLADNAGKIGVNTKEYTVFLVNWYGRPDFQFHTYTRTGTQETDTGFNFGRDRSSRKLIAWGGTASSDQSNAKRVWFYDLSAGPESWTSNWDISHPDVDDDGVADYRMPPVWEYGTRNRTYRTFGKVGPDLARVVRYVAVNLLFTPSPIYRAALTPPQQPENIDVNVALEQAAGAADPQNILKLDLLRDRVSVLQPFAKFTSTTRQSPLAGDIASAYQCFFRLGDVCSPDRADPDGDKLFNLATNELKALYAQNPNRYIVPVYAFNDAQNSQGGLLGVATDDGVTGTQAFVNSFLTPDLHDAGYGLTDTIVHEAGHHFSLSHPHDGYDSEQNLEYGPGGEFMFVNSGDESDSVMSYIDLGRTFGQFNLDSQYRYLTSAYLNNASAILGALQDNGKAKVTDADAKSADALFRQADAAYQGMRYLEAAQLAHDGYRKVVAAAQGAGVNVPAYQWFNRLSTQAIGEQAAPRRATNFLPTQGTAIRPEETKFQRQLRLSK